MAKPFIYTGACSLSKYRSEYNSWNATRHRCRNPRMTNWDHYGGEGIDMCDKWYNSFPSFLDDMGPKPGPEYVLSRHDFTKDFEPGNCLWATRHYVNNHPQRKPYKRKPKKAQ